MTLKSYPLAESIPRDEKQKGRQKRMKKKTNKKQRMRTHRKKRKVHWTGGAK